MIEYRRQTVRDDPSTPRKFIDVVMDYGGDDASLVQSDLVDYILAAYMSTGDSEYHLNFIQFDKLYQANCTFP